MTSKHIRRVAGVVMTMCAGLALANGRAIEKVGACPSGYHSSGAYCVASSTTSRMAIVKIGNACPSGYSSSGRYCLSSTTSARHALPKQGACPSGYSSSSGYCVSR